MKRGDRIKLRYKTERGRNILREWGQDWVVQGKIFPCAALNGKKGIDICIAREYKKSFHQQWSRRFIPADGGRDFIIIPQDKERDGDVCQLEGKDS